MLFQRASTVMAAEIIDEDGLVNGPISASIWRDMSVTIENKTPEEIDALLNPAFVPPGWLDSDSEPPNLEPPIKKVRLSLKLKQKSSSRFALPVSFEKLDKAAKGVVPVTTIMNNAWAERVFTAWVDERNKTTPGFVPTDLLTSHDASKLCKYTCYFVLEARTKDGKTYSPGSIRSILSSLNRILKDSKVPFSILNKTDQHFSDLQRTLDSITSDLHREGVGLAKKSATVITFQHEDLKRGS